MSSGHHRCSLLLLSVLAMPLLLGGCVATLLARKVVAPPNRSGMKALFADSVVIRQAPTAFSQVWQVSVGPPAAQIAVASIEPGNYDFRYDLQLSYPEGRPPNIDRFTVFWQPTAQRTPWTQPPRGTLLFLHGYLQDKRYLMPWALRLAQEGYRCALLDLRGHGDSTGAHISFGAFEAADVAAVLDDLARRGWDVSRVGLFGVSYGASVALLTAGRDARVASVVAFEPFASAERAVPELMRGAFSAQARGITDRQFATAHRLQARIGGFRWEQADIPAALARTRAPVLFFHGEADTWLSPEHSRELLRRAPAGSELRLVPHDNHVTLPLQIAPFEREVIGWFGATFTQP